MNESNLFNYDFFVLLHETLTGSVFFIIKTHSRQKKRAQRKKERLERIEKIKESQDGEKIKDKFHHDQRLVNKEFIASFKWQFRFIHY